MVNVMEREEIIEISIFDQHLIEKEKNRKKHEMKKLKINDYDDDDLWEIKKKRKYYNKNYR